MLMLLVIRVPALALRKHVCVGRPSWLQLDRRHFTMIGEAAKSYREEVNSTKEKENPLDLRVCYFLPALTAVFASNLEYLCRSHLAMATDHTVGIECNLPGHFL